MNHPNTGVFCLILSITLALGAGCDDKLKAPAGAPAGTAPAAPPAAAVAVPGTASGRITRPDGKPIGIDGVKYKMTVNGNAGTGNRVQYNPKPNADGTWSTKLAEGVYHEPRGTMSVPFDGDLYTYALYPTEELGDTDSAKGIVANFHWRIRGPIKMYEGKPDPGNHTHWYGATCVLSWNPNYLIAEGKYAEHKVDPKATFVFTATPNGKLIDGSEGKPLTWTLAYYSLLRTLKPNALHDLPPAVGGWRVTGKEVAPDGTERPLAIRLVGTPDKAKTEVNVKIEASTYGTPIVGPILECTRATP